jgi:hypothetical protein
MPHPVRAERLPPWRPLGRLRCRSAPPVLLTCPRKSIGAKLTVRGTPLVSVTARKIRDHGREHGSLGVGRVYAGYLISYPSVGRGMVIFRDPNGHRMVTTPVRRVLGAFDGDKLYVETENSVYQLTFRGETQVAPQRAVASQAT